MKKSSYILIAIVLIIVASVVIRLNIKPTTISPVACTMEAKLCPDGSSVGRTGPDCAFAPCPTLTTPPRTVVGTLTGHIMISPTCPVERVPPDPACAPKPFPVLLNINGPSGFHAQIHSDMNGLFLVYLPAGTYSLVTHQTTLWPRCDTQTATVTVGATTTIDISCDSGIR